MTLRYVIICDNAYTDEAGRLNIIQVFDTINATGFPAIHPRLSIVTKWDFEEGDDKEANHKQKLVIIEKNTRKEIFNKERELTAKSGRDKSLQFINNIIGLKFDQAGVYEVQVSMDGKKTEDNTNFEVKSENN